MKARAQSAEEGGRGKSSKGSTTASQPGLGHCRARLAGRALLEALQGLGGRRPEKT